jgi:hypothetical protein
LRPAGEAASFSRGNLSLTPWRPLAASHLFRLSQRYGHRGGGAIGMSKHVRLYGEQEKKIPQFEFVKRQYNGNTIPDCQFFDIM